MNERELLKAELREEIKTELIHEILISGKLPIKPLTPHRKFIQTTNELFYQYKIDLVRDYGFRAGLNGAVKQIFNIKSMPNLKEEQLKPAINFANDYLKLIYEYRNAKNKDVKK